MLHLTRSRPQRYGGAVLFTALALLLKLLLGPVLVPSAFLTSYGAVLVSAWYGGIGPGLLTTLLSAVVDTYLFLPRVLPPAVADQTAVFRVVLFVLIATLVSWFTGRVRRVHDDLQAAVAKRTADLSAAKAMLEEQLAERTRTAAVLRESEERFSNAFAHAPIGMALTELNGRPFQVNRALCGMLGYSEQELLAGPAAEATSKAELELGRSYARRLRDGELRSFQQERHFVHKSGHSVRTLLNVSLVHDHNGKVPYFICQVQDITERTRAAEALQEERNFVFAVLETVGALVGVVDREGRIVRFNRACEQALGYSCADVVGRHFWDLLPNSEEVGPAKAVFRKLLAGEWPTTYEAYWFSRDGTRRSLAWSTTFLKNEAGEIQYVIGSGIDITERKRAEAALRQAHDELEARVAQRTADLLSANVLLKEEVKQREQAEEALGQSERRFRAIFDQAGVGVALMGMDGRWLLVNQKLSDILCYSGQELLARTYRDLLHPDDLGETRALLKRLMAGEVQSYTNEKRYIRKDGTPVWVNVTASLVRDASGRSQHGIAVIEDITARKQMEDALRETNEKLEAVIHASPLAIAALDPERKVKMWSPAAERMFGWSEAEVLDHPAPFVPEGGRQEFHSLLEDEFKGRTLDGLELSRLRKDGSLIDVSLWTAPVRDADGNVRLIVSIVADITERKRAERELHELNQRIRMILESIPDGFFAVDQSGRFTYVNPSAAQMLLRSREELIGKDVWAEFPEGVNSPFYESYQRALSEQSAVDTEAYYPPLRRWFKSRAYPSAEGMSVLFEDITERHAGEVAAISDILHALNSTLDVAAAFPSVAAGLRTLSGCDRSSLITFDDNREWVTVVALDQTRPDVQPGIRLRISDIPARDMFAEQPQLFRDLTVGLHSPIVEAIYQAGMRSALTLPLRGSAELRGMLILTWRRGDGANPVQLPLLEEIAGAVALAFEKGELLQQVRIGRERLQALSHRLMEVQEAERRHLARELHDEIGQALTGLKLVLDALAVSPARTAPKRLAGAHKIVNDLVAWVRDLSLELRPAMLDDLGLLAALLWLLERYSAQTNVRVAFEHRGLERRFAPEVETAAYRIVQEALTNVARHAGVRRATVRAWADSSALGVQIVDQGAGFDAEGAPATSATSGLAGMRERALLLGGQFTVESRPGTGTRVNAELPLGVPGERRVNGHHDSLG